MGVRLAAKAGVWILALLLGALPAMACALPGAAMTAAERDCCKRMAEQCGRSGMAKSHKCCQIELSPSGSHALKRSSIQYHSSLVDLPAQLVTVQTITGSESIFALHVASSTHSPPGFACSNTTVLRI
jgi:hypothetical protein